jgi:hypothetical protein
MAEYNVNSKPVAVRRGNELLGWVSVTGQDNYWTLGIFEPAAGFAPYRSLFERELELSVQEEKCLEDENEFTASEERDELLDQINGLGLSVGDTGVQARDFKFTGSRKVEFKWGL